MMDIVKNFRKIFEKIETLKNQIVTECKINYESQDARLVALDSMQVELRSVGMWITALNSLANKCMINKEELNKEEFLKSVGSNHSIKKTEKIMLDTLRLGFITLLHFKMDNLFQNILRDLGALPEKAGYWNLCNAILRESSIPEKGDEMDILTVLAYLRNSLHNNGIHRTRFDDFCKKIKGKTFSFRNEKRVECASWDHIIVAVDSNVEILSKILLSDSIKAITHEINEDFASKNSIV